ncbi:unnamed protein product [Ixodes hexagonus]
MVPVLGYWDNRGLGQFIRNLLIYKGVPFRDKRYKFGPPPSYDVNEWQKEKFTLGLEFPSLPYYVDDDVKLTQSMAIIRYLGRNLDLGPRTDQEMTVLDVLEQQAKEMCVNLGRAVVDHPCFEDMRLEYENTMEGVLKPWDEHFQHRKWALGDRITYVDFILYEALDWNHEFKPSTFKTHQDLIHFMRRFEDLPNLREYMLSNAYNKYPIFSPRRKWGYVKE